ncbi:MAG: class I SAM-dependent DNA methyltransferase [Dysgonomonas sp.]|uniref:class I SAM-dependent DNA methyltransferase n=1 Tax=Dysgonomonas sp. TaxID=1891233 RepID=UPI00257D1BF3|nr:DNA methyltransferase [Dysgonomonas sp.]MBS7120307.1 class I SAM-dependent DNA methyltransferase [Dysgonomonas sp.]
MNSKEIEHNVGKLFETFSKEEFIFDFLIAYGISKSSVTRLKKGDYNLSKVEGEILYKKKVFFREENGDKLLSGIEFFAKEERILKHNPRFIILTDYKSLVARDLKQGKNLDIAIQELPKYFDFFLPLAGSEVYNTKNDNKADREAAYKMAELYDELRTANPGIYESKESVHELNIFLSRLLFCFFAEDTGIFEGDSVFTNTLVQHTHENGSDTHVFLNDLFRRLNSQQGDLFPAYLAKFPYVNGGLFRDVIESPLFNFKARKMLIGLGELQWQEINPDIFGSMIQAVVLPEYRSDLGMHYTSVENILKLIKPLFLDELEEEFEKRKDSELQLRKLIFRMSKMKFFDPACGSGNFLIITYKEIRLLEVKILQQIIELNPNPRIEFTQIQLSQFYGIEIDDFAHEMGILSLWLAEHQMNNYFEEQLHDYGKSKPILPLKEAGKIIKGNATRIDWKIVCPITESDEVYVIGNPPYLGYSRQDNEQKKDMSITFSGIKNYKKLDYIACWLYKATQYIENMDGKYAFVSTNSITQGEQVALLWPLILNKNQEIFFAYQSFKWKNNAKGNAGVSVIILGIRQVSSDDKFIYDKNIKQRVKNISPYLTNTTNIFVVSRPTPLCSLPAMIKGSSPGDNGNLLLSQEEKKALIDKDSRIEMFLKKYIGAKEFIDTTYRYCIYITDENANAAYKIKDLVQRFENVKAFRLASTKESTRKKADTPHLFDENKYQESDFILIPQTSSELREYIPVGFFDSSCVPSNGTRIVYNSEPWLFGMLSSKMHMVWIHATAGRLETRIQYTNTLCYNTFPFPNISIKNKENLSQYVFALLDERAKYPEKTMAQLYDPDTMPLGLRQAHKELDEAIERCYRLQPFTTDTERLEYLFKLYEEMLNKDTLFAKQKKSRTKKNKI